MWPSNPSDKFKLLSGKSAERTAMNFTNIFQKLIFHVNYRLCKILKNNSVLQHTYSFTDNLHHYLSFSRFRIKIEQGDLLPRAEEEALVLERDSDAGLH